MTIQPAQNTELIPGADRHVYYTLFSFLSPRDLSSCSCVCTSLNQKIKDFNAPERLKKACEFVAEVMSIPRRGLIDRHSRIYRTLMRQRPLTPEEWEEVRPWVSDRRSADSDLLFLPLHIKAPETPQLLNSCQGESELDKRSLVFDKTGLLLNPETRACYRRLFEVAGTILLQMGPRENEAYIPPATRIDRLVTELMDEKKVSQSDIEEAIWFIISCLYGNKFVDVKADCMTLVQVELAKLNPEELDKLADTLKETFTTFKQITAIYQTFERNQIKTIREENFGRSATVSDFLGVENGRFTRKTLFRFGGGLLCGMVVGDICDFRNSVFLRTTCMSIGLLIVTFGRLLFPIGAEIRQDEQGAEVVHYTPHPLRQRATLCYDLIAAGAILYVAYQIFNYCF